jgi:hypothetical protein
MHFLAKARGLWKRILSDRTDLNAPKKTMCQRTRIYEAYNQITNPSYRHLEAAGLQVLLMFE